VGDPLFIDAAHGDFRVKEGSPALALGFVNFPMDQFGVRTPRLRAMARTPQLPPLRIRAKKTPATMGAIHWQGATLRKMEGQEFSAIGVGADAVGVFAAEVPGESAAFDAGLRQGDLIQQVNQKAVRNAKEFLDAVAAASKEQTLNLKIIRDQRTQTVNINVPTKP
jgi:S1-C subfamily serine protease